MYIYYFTRAGFNSWGISALICDYFSMNRNKLLFGRSQYMYNVYIHVYTQVKDGNLHAHFWVEKLNPIYIQYVFRRATSSKTINIGSF